VAGPGGAHAGTEGRDFGCTILAPCLVYAALGASVACPGGVPMYNGDEDMNAADGVLASSFADIA
jgi:hypothetical protein